MAVRAFRAEHLLGLVLGALHQQALHLGIGRFQGGDVGRQPELRHLRRVFFLTVLHQVGDEARLALQLHVGVYPVVFQVL